MGVHVAKSAAKVQSVIFYLVGFVFMLGAFFGPVTDGAGGRAALAVLGPGLAWYLATAFATARLEWNEDSMTTIRFGYPPRTVDLRQLARVETNNRRGVYFVVTDRHGSTVRLPPDLYSRRSEWARALIDAIRASAATADPGAEDFLTWAASTDAS